MKWIPSLVVAVGLVGCSGKVITYTSCADGVCKGVPFNTLKEVPSYYTYDRILGADGKAIRIAGDVPGKECTPVDVEEVALVVSQVQNYIYYDAGFLETSKFNVDLNANGTLSKVATESTPAAKDVAEAIATLATAYTTLKPVSTSNMINIPQCTSKAP